VTSIRRDDRERVVTRRDRSENVERLGLVEIGGGLVGANEHLRPVERVDQLDQRNELPISFRVRDQRLGADPAAIICSLSIWTRALSCHARS